MAGVERAYEGGFPLNSISVCDVPTLGGAGRAVDDGDPARYEVLTFDRETLTYKKLILRWHPPGRCAVLQ